MDFFDKEAEVSSGESDTEYNPEAAKYKKNKEKLSRVVDDDEDEEEEEEDDGKIKHLLDELPLYQL